jgi:hypothetical protein
MVFHAFPVPAPPGPSISRMIGPPSALSSRPNWLKYWQEEAQHLLYLVQRANSDDDIDALHDLDEEARMMVDGMASRMRAEETD